VKSNYSNAMNTQYEKLYLRRAFRHDGVYSNWEYRLAIRTAFCYLTTLSASWPYVVVHRMVNEYGAFTRIKIGTVNRITGNKSLPVRLSPQQITSNLESQEFPLFMSYRLAMGSTQPSIQWVRVSFFEGLSGRVVKLATHLQLVPRSRERGSRHPLPSTTSWRYA
jgi:hypothetical protein